MPRLEIETLVIRSGKYRGLYAKIAPWQLSRTTLEQLYGRLFSSFRNRGMHAGMPTLCLVMTEEEWGSLRLQALASPDSDESSVVV
jgi:hypothetical protein